MKTCRSISQTEVIADRVLFDCVGHSLLIEFYLSYLIKITLVETKIIRLLFFQADLHYAFNSYGAALKSYLLLGALTTNYFNQISTFGPYEDEQVYS